MKTDLSKHEDSRVIKALAFASKAHGDIDQKRKYTGENYIVHPIEVASLVMHYFPNDIEMICAALIHDVVEDTEITLEDVRKEFGDNIAELVHELTDASKPEDGNRAVRKAIDKKHIAAGSVRSHSIKLADIISNTDLSNLENIFTYDRSFASKYLHEKNSVLNVLQDGHEDLLRIATDQIAAGLLQLSKKGRS